MEEKKIAGALKFLVALRGRPFTKDRLMEVFWPGVIKIGLDIAAGCPL